MGILAKQI